MAMKNLILFLFCLIAVKASANSYYGTHAGNGASLTNTPNMQFTNTVWVNGSATNTLQVLGNEQFPFNNLSNGIAQAQSTWASNFNIAVANGNTYLMPVGWRTILTNFTMFGYGPGSLASIISYGPTNNTGSILFSCYGAAEISGVAVTDYPTNGFQQQGLVSLDAATAGSAYFWVHDCCMTGLTDVTGCQWTTASNRYRFEYNTVQTDWVGVQAGSTGGNFPPATEFNCIGNVIVCLTTNDSYVNNTEGSGTNLLPIEYSAQFVRLLNNDIIWRPMGATNSITYFANLQGNANGSAFTNYTLFSGNIFDDYSRIQTSVITNLLTAGGNLKTVVTIVGRQFDETQLPNVNRAGCGYFFSGDATNTIKNNNSGFAGAFLTTDSVGGRSWSFNSGFLTNVAPSFAVTTGAPPALITTFIGGMWITNNGVAYRVPIY